MEPNLKSEPPNMLATYNQLTGFNIKMEMARLYALELFCLHFTIQDLRDLVKHIKSKGQKGRSLLFRNLISGPDSIAFAQEDIAEYKAKHRHVPMDKGRAAVLRATGRTTEKETTIKTPADILAGLKAFEDFKKLKDLL